jgi:hypothetical protein
MRRGERKMLRSGGLNQRVHKWDRQAGLLPPIDAACSTVSVCPSFPLSLSLCLSVSLLLKHGLEQVPQLVVEKRAASARSVLRGITVRCESQHTGAVFTSVADEEAFERLVLREASGRPRDFELQQDPLPPREAPELR